MIDNPFSLRSEAGPIPYWKHHKRAQKSINFIMRVIRAATDRVKESENNSDDSSIDTTRASRICFVSGEPGAGKSTLYLTLKAMLDSKQGEKYALGCPSNIGLNDLQKAVKLLEPLDLEVAGDEGENLLAAVLMRLFRKIEEHSANRQLSDCEDVIKELEDLANDIGIAWEGNLQARAGALDPDTYSGEVMRTQGARLRINERLKKALDNIAKNNCYGCNSDTLFVLPVDDLYLKPDASLQLLRLLRMISIPRLFFLVMGDINTVEALFIEKSLADWTKVAGSGLFADKSDRLGEALTRARELRARYLRKLLPPGQRTTIEAMDWHEALDFEVNSEKNIKRLEELLEEVKLDPEFPKCDANTSSLLNFLIAPPFSAKEKEDKKKQREAKGVGKEAEKEFSEKQSLKKDRAAYTAVQILDATPREMMDLGAALREVINKRNDDKVSIDCTPVLLSSVRDIVNLVREEHSFLDEKAQKVLEGILPTRVYSPEDINFKMDKLDLTIVAREWNNQVHEQLWIRSHRSLDLAVNKQNNVFVSRETELNEDKYTEDGKDPFDYLPPRPGAWFVLLHDLAYNWKPDSITGNLVERLCKKLNDWELIENVSYKKDQVDSQSNSAFYPKSRENIKASNYFTGWAVWFNGTTYKHFPIPEFNVFWQLDRFLHIWSCGLDWAKETKNNKVKIDIDKIICLWKLAERVINSDKYEQFSRRDDKWFEKSLKDIESKTTWINEKKIFLEKLESTDNEKL